jgi:hypothetical protein
MKILTKKIEPSIPVLSCLIRLLKNARLRRYPAASPSRRRGKKSLLIRRDATLRISGALHPSIFDQPAKMTFSTGSNDLKPLIA